jgi:diacylglycerol kinase family enzyme
MDRIIAVLNSRAGTLLDRGVEVAREQIREVLGRTDRSVEVVLARGRGICREIDRAAAGDYGSIIVGGGDGSVSYAARKLAGTDKTLGVLPLGTVNLLGRDLGIPPGIEPAIAALADAAPRTIDLATLNGRPFHTLSGLGFFSQMARAREETRGFVLGRFIGFGVAAARALRRSGRITIEVVADGQREIIDAAAVLVTNNRFGTDWRRPVLDAGVLEVHIAENVGAFEKLKTFADLVTGAWRENPAIRSLVTQEVTIAPGRRRTWASTDGELGRERAPLRYALQPRALKVLAPRQPTGS